MVLSAEEQARYSEASLRLTGPASLELIANRTINQDIFSILGLLPRECVDLLILDPPYNLTKRFGINMFSRRSTSSYADWLESWLEGVLRTLKPTGSVYICGDWRSSSAIHLVAEKYLHVRNRITWERDKGRGATANWKNCAEDIWFCTMSDIYYFDVEAVKLRRRVLAPYRDPSGGAKDWESSEAGRFRMTSPSNLWTDLTVPFWSMPENTDHPAQKPEKLMAKLILASSRPSDVIFDPFLGSGTTSVVAAKLGRTYVGVEVDPFYCAVTEKRLANARQNRAIQGYADGIFWDRNSLPSSRTTGTARNTDSPAPFSRIVG